MNKVLNLLPGRLYNQLALVIAAILIFTSVTYAFFIGRQQALEAHRAMEHNADVIVDNFAKTAAHHLVVEDFSGLDSFLLSAAKLPDIKSIMVISPQGTPISTIIHPPGFPPYIDYNTQKQPAPDFGTRLHVHPDNDICIHWQSIEAGNTLGYIKVMFGLEDIGNTIRSIWSRTFIFSILWILFSILLLLQILKRPITAIANLSDFARQLNVKKGEKFTIDRSCQELEQLGKSLNLASKELFVSEKKLSAERERLSTTLQSIGDAVITTDKNGKIILFNRAAELFTALSAANAVHQNIYDVFAELKCDKSIEEVIAPIIAQGHPLNEPIPINILPGRGLPPRVINLSGSPLVSGDGEVTGSVLICKDITRQVTTDEEKISLQKQLQQAQKMEAIGTLAGGIAHDFNNILTPILGYAQLVQHQLPKESELNKFQDEVINAANRAKELVQQILTFSRSAEQEIMPLQIQTVVKEAIKLLRATIPTTIEIKQNVSADCGYVLASPTQVHQIVMNLCTNAYHAMRESGGTLSILLKPIEVSASNVSQSDSLPPGEYVLLEIADTGSGVPQLIIDKIFDPYFTTKPQGEGTGMGLSVVHGIVKSYDGYLSVKSEEGKGTSFKVFLPKASTTSSKPSSRDENKIVGGSEHILLVDDDKIIVELETKMLRAMGYEVTGFLSSLEALQAFEKSPESYDLVLTDMTMPKVTGLQLMEKVHSLRPDIPVIICSGHSEITDSDKALKLGASAFILKPLEINKMATQIRDTLDKQRNHS